MSLILELSPELEEALVADASVRGVPVEDMVTHAVQIFFSHNSSEGIKAPAGEGKTAEILELVLMLHDMGKGKPEFQRGVLNAASSLRKTSSEPLTLSLWRRLDAAFEKNQAELALRKAEEERTERQVTIARLRGRFADVGPTVDEFLAERSAEGRKDAGL